MIKTKQRKKRNLSIAIIITAVILVIAILTAVYLDQIIAAFTPLHDVIVVEAGSNDFSIDQFKKKDNIKIEPITNIESINFNIPAEHKIELIVYNRNRSVTLRIVDTTPPSADSVSKEIYTFDTISIEDLVANVTDLTETTISYVTEPPFGQAGTYSVDILITDAHGNQTTVTSELNIIKDTVAPVFTEMETLVVRIGDTISYKKGVTVTDNRDEVVNFSVDSSSVNTSELGTYTVTYTATDSDGNVTTTTRSVIIQDKLVIDMDLVTQMAKEILDKIITADMSSHDKIETIYKWVKKNMTYVSSGETDIPNAAYIAFSKKRGDCFNYFAATKLLLDGCGIENMMIEREGGSSTHFWLLVNIGSGWYHYDTTPQHHLYPYTCFMKTDAEVWAYAKSRGDGRSDYYNFDTDKYPDRATEKYTEN